MSWNFTLRLVLPPRSPNNPHVEQRRHTKCLHLERWFVICFSSHVWLNCASLLTLWKLALESVKHRQVFLGRSLRISSAHTIFSRLGPLVTIACSQISKGCSRDTFLAPMKWSPKGKPVLRPMIIRSISAGIEKLEKRWNEHIALKGDYVDK